MIGRDFLGVHDNDLSPWYQVDNLTLRKLGISTPLQEIYRGSLYLMLKTVYSDHEWLPWKFRVLPKGVIGDEVVIKKALEHVETELKISCLEDWEKVSKADLARLGVRRLIPTIGRLLELVNTQKNTRVD